MEFVIIDANQKKLILYFIEKDFLIVKDERAG